MRKLFISSFRELIWLTISEVILIHILILLLLKEGKVKYFAAGLINKIYSLFVEVFYWNNWWLYLKVLETFRIGHSSYFSVCSDKRSVVTLEIRKLKKFPFRQNIAISQKNIQYTGLILFNIITYMNWKWVMVWNSFFVHRFNLLLAFLPLQLIAKFTFVELVYSALETPGHFLITLMVTIV